MKNSKAKKLVIMGIGCVLLLLISSWYSVTFNDSRIVKLTDYSTYVFNPKDIPMIASILLFVVYVFYLVFFLIKLSIKNRRSNPNHTRTLNPKLGLLGFFGFLGFAGIATYSYDKTIFPFIFFIFFGFFGFYFEGKMSNTLIDERFKENRDKAQLKAYKIGFGLLFIIIFLVGRGLFADSLEFCAAFMIASISIIYAITLFLSEYFLYRLDHEDQGGE